MSVKLLTEHHLKFLSLKGGCTGLSQSTLHCWKSHVTAHMFCLILNVFYHDVFIIKLNPCHAEYLYLSVTSHINCIGACCVSLSMCLYQVMMTLHFLNEVANDAESTTKSKITS